MQINHRKFEACKNTSRAKEPRGTENTNDMGKEKGVINKPNLIQNLLDGSILQFRVILKRRLQKERYKVPIEKYKRIIIHPRKQIRT
jgi:hypothetical protein